MCRGPEVVKMKKKEEEIKWKKEDAAEQKKKKQMRWENASWINAILSPLLTEQKHFENKSL